MKFKILLLTRSALPIAFTALTFLVFCSNDLRSQVSLSIPASGDFAFGSDPRTTYIYSTTDVISYLVATASGEGFTFANASITSSTSSICSPAERRIQINAFELQLVSTSASKIVIRGNSSGAGARYLRALYVDDVLLIANGDDPKVTSFHPGGSASENCGDITIEGLNIAQGSKVKVVIGGSATGTPQNFRLNILTITPATPLPVRLISFSAQRQGNQVGIQWTAGNEVEGEAYTVQRSTNGLQFENIATMAVNGTGRYNFTDVPVGNARQLYYRLEMLSRSGVITHSKIKAVQFAEQHELKLLGNPVQGGRLVATFQTTEWQAEARIVSTTGVVLRKQPVPAFASQATIPTDGLPKGLYFLQLVSNEEIQTVRFLQQ